MSGKEPVYKVRVQEEFSASHQLLNYGGKCERMHGHNFLVRAEVEGRELDPQTGLLVDFKELRGRLRQIVEQLDHSHLNELEPFRESSPSSENLAQYIYTRLERSLEGLNMLLREVSVFEKEGSRATYTER